MTEQHNFNAGPSALPFAVKESIHKAIDEIAGGPGILELSHRSRDFEYIIEGARESIKNLYQLPDSHEVLFLQGGASLQFAMIPLNLGSNVGFVTTGVWSERAFAEAQRLTYSQETCPVEISTASPSFDRVFREITDPKGQVFDRDYIHITSNNTIYGTQYSALPTASMEGDTRALSNLVIDASSDIFSRPIDWSRVALLYAGAQKNAGPSGVTIVIVRKEISRAAPRHPLCPKIMAYSTHAEKKSLYHTPNTLGVFAVGEVAKWVESLGGIEVMKQRSEKRSQRLYDLIDRYEVYQGHAQQASRSMMNITFRVNDVLLEAEFLKRAKARSMWGLKGHRSVGGLRASMYNAVQDHSVDRLCELLEEIGEEASG